MLPLPYLSVDNLNKTLKNNVMAVVKNGSLSGMVGPVVAYKWRGIDCVRARPKVRKFRDCSEREQANRNSFKAVNEFAGILQHTLIKSIWDRDDNDMMTAYNRFIKENKKAFNGDGKLIDPRMLKLTVGKLPLPLNIILNTNVEEALIAEISWENPPLIDSWYNSDQLLCILFVNGKPDQLIETEFTRQDQKALIQLPDLEGKEYCLYVFFCNQEGSRYSDSWGLVG